MRAGAGISAVFLLAGYLADWRPVAPVVAIVLGIGSIFGLRYSPLGFLYRSSKNLFGWQIPVDPEEEPPPRFAQTLGFIFLAASSASFWALHSRVLGWTLALLVAGLQTLLAATGICVGCEMYVFARRLSGRGARPA